MRVRVHQMLVALPLTLVSALGIAVGVQSFSLESADLLAIAPADAPLPLDAIRGSVEGVVLPPPPARPVEPTPAVRGITGFTAPAGAAIPGQPAPAVKVPAARNQRPKPAAAPRTVPRDPNCRPADTTMHRLPTPTGSARANSRERAVSGPAPGAPLLPRSVPARNSAGLPGSGSPVTGLINRPSTSRPGRSTSGPGPSISQPSSARPSSSQPGASGTASGTQTSRTQTDPSQGMPEMTPFADSQPVAMLEETPQADDQQVGTPGQTPRVADCSGPDPSRPGRPSRRRVPTTEPVVARDSGLTAPARSGW